MQVAYLRNKNNSFIVSIYSELKNEDVHLCLFSVNIKIVRTRTSAEQFKIYDLQDGHSDLYKFQTLDSAFI